MVRSRRVRTFEAITVNLHARPRVTPSVLSVRMEQCSSHWADFHEIWYRRDFVEKLRIWLKIGEKYWALYTKTWYVLSFPASLSRDKSALFAWSGFRRLGERKRCQHQRHSVTLYVLYLPFRSSLQSFKARGCLKIGN
jgi:hypothetical protein